MQWTHWGGTKGWWEQKASRGSTYETEVQENWEVVEQWKETERIS